jgi:putative membrane protein
MLSDQRGGGRGVSLATYFAIVLFNLYTLILYFNNQLTLYIHPRYILFSVAFNALSLVACSVGFVLTAWRMGSEDSALTGSLKGRSVPWRPSITVVLAGFVLVAAYSLPARTLSSDTAQQRSSNFNDTQLLQPSEGGGGAAAAVGVVGGGGGGGATGSDTLALFEVDTSQLNIADWVSAFNMKTSASFYEGKKVDVVGFVFHPKGTPKDVFYVSRFRLTCCAVDAQPLGLPVYSEGWQEQFKEDSWVHLIGQFTQKTDQDIAEPAIITPQSIEPTQQPENPYVT